MVSLEMSAAVHTVFACESAPVMLAGLRRILEDCPDMQLAGAANSLAEALPLIEALRPSVVLVDHSAGMRATVQFFMELRRRVPESAAVLWAEAVVEADCLRALQAGVRGILKRTAAPETLLECLRAVVQGQLWIEGTGCNSSEAHLFYRKSTLRLTPREHEIADLVSRGLKNRQIAEQLSITPGTVKVHLMHVFEKTGVKDRQELALRYRKAAETETGSSQGKESAHG